ncbi:MAG: DUF2974 domain-containing protein [Lachnospiraceae bacterium]|nr:DUF2974 domain-containing protein [Lachnospiraceae bacterium]
MSTILNYCENEKRTFDEFPFNPIDALVFAEATYFQWEYLLHNIWTPEWPYNLSESMFFHEMPKASEMPLFGQYAADTPNNLKMIDILRESPRYMNVSISHLCARTNDREQIQFAAMCFHISDDICFVAFRGTDGTLIGWKEDFQLSYQYPVPAQEESARYLNYLSRELAPQTKFYIGGHSKGGNLSIYSATSCANIIKSRILGVFSFDGPGFSFNLHETEEYKKIAPVVHHLVPSSSFVGMLLQSAPGTKYIENKALWLMQHSPFTWEVGDDDFKYDPAGWDKNAQVRIGAVNSWLKDQSFEDREEFTEMLYHIATSSGASNIFRPDSSWSVKMSHIIDATKAVDAKSRAKLVETMRLLVLLSFRQRR